MGDPDLGLWLSAYWRVWRLYSRLQTIYHIRICSHMLVLDNVVVACRLRALCVLGLFRDRLGAELLDSARSNGSNVCSDAEAGSRAARPTTPRGQADVCLRLTLRATREPGNGSRASWRGHVFAWVDNLGFCAFYNFFSYAPLARRCTHDGQAGFVLLRFWS